MPNLKVLLLKCYNEIGPCLRAFGIEIVPNEEEIGLYLDGEMAQIEFRYIPSLKLVVTSHNLSTLVLRQIRSRNPHVVCMQG